MDFEQARALLAEYQVDLTRVRNYYWERRRPGKYELHIRTHEKFYTSFVRVNTLKEAVEVGIREASAIDLNAVAQQKEWAEDCKYMREHGLLDELGHPVASRETPGDHSDSSEFDDDIPI